MCLNPLFLRILYLTKIAINILRFLVPLFLIFKLILSVYQRIINPKDSEGIKIIRDRIIAAVIVFLVPTIVGLVISFITTVSGTDVNNGLNVCLEFSNLEYIEKLEKKLDDEQLNAYLDESQLNLSEYDRKVEAIRIMVQEQREASIGNYTGNKNNLACNSGSQYNQGLFDMVRQAGAKTRNGVVAAALYLSSHIDVKIPYFWSGGSKPELGVSNKWGCDKKMPSPGTSAQIAGKMYPNGLDCCGFVGWAIVNGGYYTGGDQSNVVPYTRHEVGYFYSLGGISLPNVAVSKAKGKIKPGDIATKYRHVGMVVEVNDDGFKVAEEKGYSNGLIIKEYKYKDTQNGFKYIVQMDKFYANYKKDVAINEIFK